MNLRHHLIVLMLASTLLACSPQYQIVDDYLVSENSATLMCIKNQCNPQRALCTERCETKIEHCMHRQEAMAKDELARLNDGYQLELIAYHSKLEQYHFEKQYYDKRKNRLTNVKEKARIDCKAGKELRCRDVEVYKKELKHLISPSKPQEPSKPDSGNLVKQYQENCESLCHCKEAFSQCYSGCGGQVIKRRVCIKNCD